MSGEQRRSRGRTIAIVLGSLAVVVLVCGAAWIFRPRPSDAVDTNWAALPVQEQLMVAQVAASGVIGPEQQATLSFATNGLVKEVLVEVGDEVSATDVLATLQADDLELELARAQASLDQSIANHERAKDGATPAEIAAAEAQIAASAGSLQQTLGNVTQADIDSAQAQVAQAQAALAKLNSGPRSADVANAQAQVDSALASLASAQAQLGSAQAQLDSAKANLEQSRTTLSATKTQAEAAVTQAANAVRDRQAEYAAKRDANQELRDAGIDPPQEALDAEASALRAVDNAQLELGNARVAYDAAFQNEITGLAQSQAQVDQSQAQVDQSQAQVDQSQAQVDQANASLAKLLSPAEADQIAQAQANLASARANLQKLTGGNRAGSINAARGTVAQSQANLDRLREEKNPSDLAVAAAQVKSAEASRDLARLQLERAELRAPFAGTVAAVQLHVGETANPAAITLTDLSKLHVDATVDEIDVARVAVNQPVSVTLDALPNLSLRGIIRSIAPLAIEEASGATSYQVRIDILDKAPGVRPGMSATAEIEVARKPAALVVPRRALHQDGDRTTVAVVTGAPDQPGARPPTTEVVVALGLTNEQTVEIVSGLKAGDQVLVEGVNANFLLQNGGGPPGR